MLGLTLIYGETSVPSGLRRELGGKVVESINVPGAEHIGEE